MSFTNLPLEAIYFGLLMHGMRQLERPCPDRRYYPGGANIWWEHRELILRIPGYEDLERYANSVLKQDLNLKAMDQIRRDAAQRLGMRFSEVDLLLVREVAEVLRGLVTGVGRPARKSDDGFERITVAEMHREWGIGKDKIELMAKRAVQDDRIHADWKVIQPGKRKELWIRRKG
jgi:hypothetical protein